MGAGLLESSFLGEERRQPALGEDKRQSVKSQLLAGGGLAERVDDVAEALFRRDQITQAEPRRTDVERR